MYLNRANIKEFIKKYINVDILEEITSKPDDADLIIEHHADEILHLTTDEVYDEIVEILTEVINDQRPTKFANAYVKADKEADIPDKRDKF